MNAKGPILSRNEARKAFVAGVNKVANLVRITLGPKGRTVIIGKALGQPLVTKDGVTVARHIHLSNPYEDMGARLCSEVATNTNDRVGDGTTTATVLAQAMVNEGFRFIENGANPTQFKKGMDRAVESITEAILRQSIEVSKPETILQVATIAAQDPKIGKLIADAMSKAGKDAAITVRATKKSHTYVETADGMQLDKGYISSAFINNEEQMAVELDDPFILITDGILSSADDLIGVLNKANREHRGLLVIAEDVIEEALSTLILNIQARNVTAAAVRAPSFGRYRKAILEDLAVITGGTLISQEAGLSVQHMKVASLGMARKIIISRHKTTVIGGNGLPEDIADRIKHVKALANRVSDIQEQAELQKRIAKLSNATAVIWLGANTEIAMKELKGRVIDALYSTQAAMESGVVPGGGCVFISAANSLTQISCNSDDELAGIRLVQKALEEPLRRIAANAGYDGDKIVAAVKELPVGMGFDAMTGAFVDLYSAGIVDSAKVAITSLRNAASIVSTLLTMEIMIG